MPRRKIKTRFFFWEGKIHKVLRINYPANLVEAWRFADETRVTLLYSDWRQNAGKALSQRQASKLIRLTTKTLDNYVIRGMIPPPQRTHALDGAKRGWNKWWSEQDMLALHDYLMSHHFGRTRADGRITPMQHLPSRAEIVAAFNESQAVYVQAEDGTMIPLFKPPKV